MMNGTRVARYARQPGVYGAARRRNASVPRALIIALAVLVLAGALTQIVMLARINAQRQEQALIEKEMRTLNAQIENTNRSLESYHDHDRVRARAEQLGMVEATDAQLRVIRPIGLSGDETVQAVDAGASN